METTRNAYETAMVNAGAKRCDDFGRHIAGSGHFRAECPGIKATYELRMAAALALAEDTAPVYSVTNPYPHAYNVVNRHGDVIGSFVSADTMSRKANEEAKEKAHDQCNTLNRFFA